MVFLGQGVERTPSTLISQRSDMVLGDVGLIRVPRRDHQKGGRINVLAQVTARDRNMLHVDLLTSDSYATDFALKQQIHVQDFVKSELKSVMLTV